ncbi:MAG: putative DNA modification/repair radical SAM protein [Bosea sp.]|uniref:putative DNA modification/repair radical SAM protein n=1 Tax=unclassified Bosea (in: a-proteobacteria) TaxID=2653178 RepID=UPI000969DE2D|nr:MULTISPECIES: putative DNA modification/repair radical SAM protein [unclassified Bosea (in: a-proteobacteria)]MBN9456234.1 putative DNA modification/repair radical SAM protein [Bosea sp. (in: a-proteobacteria)]OJV05727.1 MAG: putative DNA modification/repair radical SAM protein [Bosea sp. 67-29]
MSRLTTLEKLEILSDAAKYDASCASSSTTLRNSRDGRGLGSTTGAGICHSYAPDGRCISLLKILLTNFCSFDCVFCINRSSSNVRRARFSVDEVVKLTLDFYRRNYIEGLFLSSGIIRSPDYTMAEIVRVAEALRLQHGFRGYIHLKLIPGASQDLIEQAGRFADRVSVNVELPSEATLARFAPEKSPVAIRSAMGGLRLKIDEAQEAREASRKAPVFAPAGQSTQMIVGADDATDGAILRRSALLYGSYGLKRVYYSAFSPIPDASRQLPVAAAPLMREHRLYQADWLTRFYGFETEEIIAPGEMLDLDVDPKLAWALRHRGRFPVDVNRADRESLLRVPGLGTRSVDRILASRRFRTLRLEDVGRLTRSLRVARHFLTAAGWSPGKGLDEPMLKARLTPRPQQLSLFA